jgi:hypothetical protein
MVNETSGAPIPDRPILPAGLEVRPVVEADLRRRIGTPTQKEAFLATMGTRRRTEAFRCWPLFA